MSDTEITSSSIVPDAAEIVESKPTKGGSKNALTHGVYATEIVVEGESAEEFNSLYGALSDELNSEGPSEQAEIIEIAQLRWTRRRLIRVHGQSKGLRSISSMLHDGDPIFTGSAPDMKAYLKKLDELAKETGIYQILLQKVQTDGTKDLTEAQRQVVKALGRAADHGGAATSDPNRYCEELDHFLKLLGMIDTRIEKAMSRLIAYKEYKRQYGRGVVNDQKN